MSFHCKFEVLPPDQFTQIRTHGKCFFPHISREDIFSVSRGSQNKAEAGSGLISQLHLHDSHLIPLPCHLALKTTVLVQHLAACSSPGSLIEPLKNSRALSSLISSSDKKQERRYPVSFCGRSCVSAVSQFQK